MESDTTNTPTVNTKLNWPRLLAIIGLVAMVVGIIDPLEGSIVTLAGIALVTAGALIAKSPQRKLMLWSLALAALGVAALWGFSALGGIGGNSGRSYWWALTFVPYPAGWVLGLIGAYRSLRVSPAPQLR